jgi:hypothetical protein
MITKNIKVNPSEEIYKALRPYKFEGLIRVGGFKDGGYVVPEAYLKNLTTFVNFGVGEDFDFELELLNRYHVLHILSFDNLVSLRYFIIHALKGLAKFALRKANFYLAYFRLTLLVKYVKFYLLEPQVKFFKINIDKDRTEKVFSTLPINSGLKVDIEGSEYKILDVIALYKSNFNFIIIEFHSVQLHKVKIIKFLNNMSNEFQVAHTSFNNIISDVQLNPQTIEVTLCKTGKLLNSCIERLPNPKLDWHFPNRPIYELDFTLENL